MTSKTVAKSNTSFVLLTDQAKLLSAIKGAHSAQAKLDKQFHFLACASLAMAAKDGQVAPLNALYKGLRPAMQSAFKAWVAYIASDVAYPNGLGEGEGWIRPFNKAEKEVESDGFFRVINDRMNQRKVFTAELEVIVLGTEATERQYLGKDIKPFTQHKVHGGNVNVFNNNKILDTLGSLRKSAAKEENNIPREIRDILDQAYKQIDVMTMRIESNVEEAQLIQHVAQSAPVSMNAIN